MPTFLTADTPDLDLPQLTLAANADAMRELVAAHFDIRANSADCQLARIRYRRGQRAILQYSVGMQWVTALVYPPAELPRVWRKIQRQLGASPEMAAHVVMLDAHHLILQRFPFDWNLPTLSTAITALPQRLRDTLNLLASPIKLRQCAIGLGWVRCSAAPPAYVSPSQPAGVFAKVFTQAEGERSFAVLTKLQNQRSFEPLSPWPSSATSIPWCLLQHRAPP